MIYLGTKFHEDRLRVITVEKKITKPGSLTYKGRPLVRSGNTIYYGDMGDKYVAMLQILSEADFDGETLPTKVSVQIWSTDEELRPRDRVVKKEALARRWNLPPSGLSASSARKKPE